jgi:phage repressor protein C with HTH and peptisase S24 domain
MKNQKVSRRDFMTFSGLSIATAPFLSLQNQKLSEEHKTTVVEKTDHKPFFIGRIKLGLKMKNLKLIRAHGNTMTPTISDGDLLMIDINQNYFNSDAVYLLRIDAKYLVPKRLQHTTDQGLLIINDNASYRDQSISAKQKDSLDIVGKVIWTAGPI